MAISPFKMRKSPKGISSWKEFFLVNTMLSFEVVTGMQRNNIRRLGAHRCETTAMNKKRRTQSGQSLKAETASMARSMRVSS